MEERKQTRKRPKKKKNSNPIYLGISIFLVLNAFLLISVLRSFAKPQIPTETIAYDSLTENKNLDGVIIRDEIVVKAVDLSGKTVYHYNNNEKVKSSDLVLSIKNDDESDGIEKQLEELEQDIIKQQDKRKDLTIYKNEINALDNNIDDLLANSQNKINNGDLESVYMLKDSIYNAMNERTIMLLSEEKGELANLVDDRLAYEEQLNRYIKSYDAGQSGILSYYVDGYETSLNPESMKNISKSELKVENKVIPSSRTVSIDKNASLFKVIKSNSWYIAGYYKNSDLGEIKEGDKLQISAKTKDDSKKMLANVYHLDASEGESFLILRLDDYMTNFSLERTVKFSISEEKTNGIKISNSAISEKTAILVPKDYIVNNSVLLKKENKDELIPLSLYSFNDEYSYFILTDDSRIKINDQIIKASKNDTSENKTFTLDKVEAIKGVYVVNSGVAKFKSIGNILASNSEFTMVEIGTGSIMAFDNIVLDANLVSENQSVYQ